MVRKFCKELMTPLEEWHPKRLFSGRAASKSGGKVPGEEECAKTRPLAALSTNTEISLISLSLGWKRLESIESGANERNGSIIIIVSFCPFKSFAFKCLYSSGDFDQSGAAG